MFLITAVMIFWILFNPVQSYSADVMYIDFKTGGADSTDLVGDACLYYGLSLEREAVKSITGIDRMRHSLVETAPEAVIISGDAYTLLYNESQQRHDSSLLNFDVPLLITDIGTDFDSDALTHITGETAEICDIDDSGPYRSVHFADNPKMCRQLGGMDISVSGLEGQCINADITKIEPIITFGSNGQIIFGLIDRHSVSIFVLSSCKSIISYRKNSNRLTKEEFIDLSPYLLFLKAVFGERCWKSPGNYANLTIDDPWLKEPYGSLSFKEMAKEISHECFHLTIGFIPWNYKRIDQSAIDYFKYNPEKFSLCYHGNNHDHYEFSTYYNVPGDSRPSKPFEEQRTDIETALARMDTFYRRTGLACDKVMVFPQNIAPAQTLELLKEYNFLATVNSEHIPLGSAAPDGLQHKLRTVCDNYNYFPSIRRFPAGMIGADDAAIQLFLGNPLLLYGHVYAFNDMFENGSDAFNGIAGIINTIEPDIVWTGLENIARHLYIERLNLDGNYEVRAFSRSVILSNQSDEIRYYDYWKAESSVPPIKEVMIDGMPAEFKMSNNRLRLTLSLPPRSSSQIDIEYTNDFAAASVDLSGFDVRVSMIRYLSDFRDNTLASNKIGRKLIHFYYAGRFYRYGLLAVFFIVLSVITFALIALYVIHRLIRSIKYHSRHGYT